MALRLWAEAAAISHGRVLAASRACFNRSANLELRTLTGASSLSSRRWLLGADVPSALCSSKWFPAARTRKGNVSPNPRPGTPASRNCSGGFPSRLGAAIVPVKDKRGKGAE